MANFLEGLDQVVLLRISRAVCLTVGWKARDQEWKGQGEISGSLDQLVFEMDRKCIFLFSELHTLLVLCSHMLSI